MIGLVPLAKVEADYLPPPKNQFVIKVNGDEYYTLVKEDLGVDLSQVEFLRCKNLKVNDDDVFSGSIPWVLDQFEDKLNRVYKGQPLESLEIVELDCKS